MPLLDSAIKKLRQDRRKTKVNDRIRNQFKRALSLMRKKPTKTQLAKVSSLLDRAAKTHVIHENKASRLKSRLARLLR